MYPVRTLGLYNGGHMNQTIIEIYQENNWTSDDSDCLTRDEHVTTCDRMEMWLDDYAPAGLDFYIREPLQGEAAIVRVDGYPLRYADPEDQELIQDLINQAWEHACETIDS